MEAFGHPGISPTWTSSAKDLVSTALGRNRLWITLGFGVLNEIYWPSTGRPQIRDLGFIVAKPGSWTEVKRAAHYRLETPDPAIPLARVVHQGEDYSLELEYLPSPNRDSLLIAYRLEGQGYRLYPLLAPHLSAEQENTAWSERGALMAVGGTAALCLMDSEGFSRSSVGFVGASDGWQDFSQHGQMTYTFDRATSGNVAMMAELSGAQGTLALALAETPEGARTLAASSLAEGYSLARETFLDHWKQWAAELDLPSGTPSQREMAARSAAVLKIHEDKTYPGAVVASLSVPWGDSRFDLGGYHLVWARDAVEAGLGLLAAGQVGEARHMLAYLVATQQADGHWTQNFYPDGRPYWTGIQIDEVGFPILLAAKLKEIGQLDGLHGVRTMVEAATRFLVCKGPLSPQDRWEENSGANPFTLAVEVAALVAAAEILEGDQKAYALALADCWNELIESWTYVTDTPLARAHRIPGYYVRLSPSGAASLRGRVEIKNRSGESIETSNLIGPEFLYLTRLGLRRADDPRIAASVQLIDQLLRVETPSGALYYRYNEDGYGEHEDGRPFDGSGVGRLWPLLVGERGHHALLAGEDPLPYLETMAKATGPGGLIPEQVWDREPIPQHNLFPGKPSGSAMPLVWAHAEYLKLLCAVGAGRPLEQLACVTARYGSERAAASWHWREEVPFEQIPAGRQLVIEDRQPFQLHLGWDSWEQPQDLSSEELFPGIHGVRLAWPQGAQQLLFTRLRSGGWEGTDHSVSLDPGAVLG